MNYNLEVFSKIVKDMDSDLETILDRTKDFVVFDNHPNSNGMAFGNVVKEHEDCTFKIGELVFSEYANTIGNNFLLNIAFPDTIIKYEPKIEVKPKVLKGELPKLFDSEAFFIKRRIYNAEKEIPFEEIWASNRVEYLMSKGWTATNATKRVSKMTGIHKDTLYKGVQRRRICIRWGRYDYKKYS